MIRCSSYKAAVHVDIVHQPNDYYRDVSITLSNSLTHCEMDSFEQYASFKQSLPILQPEDGYLATATKKSLSDDSYVSEKPTDKLHSKNSTLFTHNFGGADEVVTVHSNAVVNIMHQPNDYYRDVSMTLPISLTHRGIESFGQYASFRQSLPILQSEDGYLVTGFCIESVVTDEVSGCSAMIQPLCPVCLPEGYNTNSVMALVVSRCSAMIQPSVCLLEGFCIESVVTDEVSGCSAMIQPSVCLPEGYNTNSVMAHEVSRSSAIIQPPVCLLEGLNTKSVMTYEVSGCSAMIQPSVCLPEDTNKLASVPVTVTEGVSATVLIIQPLLLLIAIPIMIIVIILLSLSCGRKSRVSRRGDQIRNVISRFELPTLKKLNSV